MADSLCPCIHLSEVSVSESRQNVHVTCILERCTMYVHKEVVRVLSRIYRLGEKSLSLPSWVRGHAPPPPTQKLL